VVALFALFAPSIDVGPAWSWIEATPPFQHPERFPGLQPILENTGKNVHNCGNILFLVSNFGLFGSTPDLPPFPWREAPSLQWPAASGIEYLFAAGLWVGAVKSGEKLVTTGAFPFEFFPGLLPQQRMYTTHEGARGGARAPAPNADDDRDGRTDEDWLNGFDDDGDGLVDEDFAAISNQMFSCEYNDFDPIIRLNLPEHKPLGVLVQQATYCWEEPDRDDFIAFDFKIINKGTEPLFDLYIGFWADADIGLRANNRRAEDDEAGFWEGILPARTGTEVKNVKLSMGYMFDDDGDDGRAPGTIGLAFLGAQDPGSDTGPRFMSLRNFRFFSARAPFSLGGDPNNDEEAYAILDGTAPQSLPPPGGPNELRPATVARRADDYRLLVSTGPFPVVNPGDTLGFQAALVLGDGFDGMIENAKAAQLTYDGVWLDCDQNPTTGVSGRETPVCGPELTGRVFRLDPCDSICDFAPPSDPRCFATVPTDACVWINADCEFERLTEFPTGVEGKECLIHWLVSTAPPPPSMRLQASENRVDILWDNASETAPDLRTNILDFESYRIWRAEHWTRPLGTDVRTGPASNLWMLLAEYDLQHNGIGADTGLQSLLYTPQIPAAAVEYYREWFAAHPYLEPPDLPGFTPDQNDTAKALSKGTRYYRYTDPPLKSSGCVHDAGAPGHCETVPCPADGRCPAVTTAKGVVATRCNDRGWCQETAPGPHSGVHYFYSVTATDHRTELENGVYVAVGPGLAGDPSSNFVYLTPPTDALPPERWADASSEIYVVPNPATRQSLSDWQLQPNNDDPTGVKVEFHNLPRSRGRVSVFTLASDLVVELPFDGSTGNGTLAWDLLSRNGQEVTSGVYLYVVEAEQFDRVVGKFVVIR